MESVVEFSLLDFPPELLLRILSFMDVHTLYTKVIFTCRRLHQLLTSLGVWKTLFDLKYEGEFEIVRDLPYVKDWRRVCESYDEVHAHWKQVKQKVKLPQQKDKLRQVKLSGHYASVDAVHIVANHNIAVSGSRDRTALVWNLRGFVDAEDEMPACDSLSGHKGWIWAIDSFDHRSNEVVTCSWDNTVKVWDLNDITFGSIATYKYHPAAVLDIKCHDNVFTTSCYDKVIRVFDPRSEKVVAQSLHHKRPVLCVQVTDKYIVSGSEDKTVGVFDVRANKLIQSLQVDTPVLCMHQGTKHGFNYLRVGGKDGSVITYDSNTFTLLDSSQLWSRGHKVTSMCSFAGGVVVGSQSGALYAYTPDRSCRLLRKLDAHAADASSSFARDNLMVTGGSDSSVVAWTWKN